MPLFEKLVEVIGVSHAVGALRGDELYQIGFGEIGKQSQPNPNATLPRNAKIAALWVVLFIPKGQPSPYALGSRWRLKVEQDGRVSIDPVATTRRARGKGK
jgi:hypothetical protein